MVQYSFLVITVLIAGCSGTCFCMIWYLFLVVAVDYFYSFLVVTVLISGCFSTHFRLLQYFFLVVTVLVWHLLLFVKVLVSDCFSTHFTFLEQVLFETRRNCVSRYFRLTQRLRRILCPKLNEVNC
jgi:hypothetical protein